MKRKLIIKLQIVLFALVSMNPLSAKPLWGGTKLTDVSKLSSIRVAEIFTPKSVEELQQFLQKKKYILPLSIKGAGFSQGWQTAAKNGTVIDLSQLNKIINLDVAHKKVTVQPNVTWYQLQKYIDSYNLSVNVMQSYHDFSIGGSLGVNVHGRDIWCGSLIQTVESIKVLCADGSLVTADRTNNADLFKAAIGGYGGVGIIIEATLHLTDNYMIELKTRKIYKKDYNDFFKNSIRYKDSPIILHNANIYPNNFDTLISLEWHKTNKPATQDTSVQDCKRFHWKQMILEQCGRLVRDPINNFRFALDITKKSHVVPRNHEIGYCTNSLEPLFRWPTTSILQEYFIPIDQFENFLKKAELIIKQCKVKVLNISIRYVPKDTDSTLAYAGTDSFAFVFYINVPRSKWYENWRRSWSQKLINAALETGGTFYLPYQLYATKQQFNKAYGDRLNTYLKVKQKYDPDNLFNNEMLKKYIF